MNKKSKTLFILFTLFFTIVILEVFYLDATKSMTKESFEKKTEFLKLSTLPDLAISTESNAIRHRSLNNIFSIYKDDGSLREYYKPTFTISHSHIEHK